VVKVLKAAQRLLLLWTGVDTAIAWLRIGGWPANNEDPWILTFGKAGVAAGVASLT